MTPTVTPKAKPSKHPGGFDVQLREPLDFYAVTDHAMFLGVMKEAADTTTEFSKLDMAKAASQLEPAREFDRGKHGSTSTGLFRHSFLQPFKA